jgi:hypothetical protein
MQEGIGELDILYDRIEFEYDRGIELLAESDPIQALEWATRLAHLKQERLLCSKA